MKYVTNLKTFIPFNKLYYFFLKLVKKLRKNLLSSQMLFILDEIFFLKIIEKIFESFFP